MKGEEGFLECMGWNGHGSRGEIFLRFVTWSDERDVGGMNVHGGSSRKSGERAAAEYRS